jgi:hypothetical protein
VAAAHVVQNIEATTPSYVQFSCGQLVDQLGGMFRQYYDGSASDRI